MNRLEIEQKILHHSRQISDEALLEVLHYLEFLEQKKFYSIINPINVLILQK
jgi:hypothetical protein